MRFLSPWVFLLLLIIPVYIFIKIRFRSTGSIGFSSLINVRRAGISLRQRLSVIPLVLQIAALILLIIALARPQMGREKVKDVTKGVAMAMVMAARKRIWRQKETGATGQVWRKTMKINPPTTATARLDMLKWMPSIG
jgi:uncharacterized membrane protein YoaK (UPF0700 family)